MAGPDPSVQVLVTLIGLNQAAGVVGVVAFFVFLKRLGVSRPAALAAVWALIMTNGYLNNMQSGAPYAFGLTLEIAALALLAAPTGRPGRGLWGAAGAGLALAGATLAWSPFVLVAPAVVLFPVIWFGWRQREAWERALVVAAVFTLADVLSFAVIARLCGIHDLPGVLRWVKSATGGTIRLGGLPRMALGVPRSFIQISRDGYLFKRFLLHDPLNPVLLSQLLCGSLAIIALFYGTAFLTAVELLRSAPGRRLLAWGLILALPTLLAGLLWQGGDIERYVALYPAFFAAVGLVLARPSRRAVAALLLVYCLVATVMNLAETSLWARQRRQAEVMTRCGALLPDLGSADRVWLVSPRDPLFIVWSDPLAGRNLFLCRHLGWIFSTELLDPSGWRANFARRTQEAWDKGGTAWVSTRTLQPRPHPDWGWVEGEFPGATWSDISAFFRTLEWGENRGGPEGFLRLPPTPRNRRLLSESERSGDGQALDQDRAPVEAQPQRRPDGAIPAPAHDAPILRARRAARTTNCTGVYTPRDAEVSLTPMALPRRRRPGHPGSARSASPDRSRRPGSRA
jgi:hypothetical protein